MSVHHSPHLLVHFLILSLSSLVFFHFLYPSTSPFCSSFFYTQISLLFCLCPFFFPFLLSSRLKCWHNVSATCIATWQAHRNIERTFPGPRVCASACPSSSSSSSRSPPAVAQMRLGCANSADFLSDGCQKRMKGFGVFACLFICLHQVWGEKSHLDYQSCETSGCKI